MTSKQWWVELFQAFAPWHGFFGLGAVLLAAGFGLTFSDYSFGVAPELRVLAIVIGFICLLIATALKWYKSVKESK